MSEDELARDRGAERADLRGGGRPRAARAGARSRHRSSSTSSPEPWRPDALARRASRRHAARTQTLVQAINATLKEEFRAQPRHLHLGPGRRLPRQGRRLQRHQGHAAGVRRGARLQRRRSPRTSSSARPTASRRLSDTIRVVVEGAEFADYFWPAAEQMVEMSHEYWRTNGQFVPNVTVRLASGGYIGGGLYHSQNIEGWLTTLPGLRIVVPAFADDAAGLLRTAIRSRGITIYLEPKFLYNNPMARARVPDGVRRAVRQGARAPRGHGPDDRRLRHAGPLRARGGRRAREGGQERRGPRPALARAARPRRDPRARCARRAASSSRTRTRSTAASAARSPRRSRKQAFAELDAPIGRVGSEFTPVGFSRILERAILPNTEKVLAAARKVLAY